MAITKDDVMVPCDVPQAMQEQYISNYLAATRESGRLMLFAGDQKVEHLNDDFYGEGIHPDDNDPEHLFRIAGCGKIGVFATQGLFEQAEKHYALDCIECGACGFGCPARIPLVHLIRYAKAEVMAKKKD